MKLATLRDGGAADGRLVVVSRDLTRCSDARHLAPTLRAALDDWERVAPQLELVALGVETGGQPVERFHERDALAPLPRTQRACARGTIRLADGAGGLAPGFAAITGAVPAGAGNVAARAAVRLVMLAGEPAAAGAATAFSPVAVTPDEIEEPGGRLIVDLNGNPFSRAELGPGVVADLGTLVAVASAEGALGAGGIVGPGPAQAGEPGPASLRPGDTIRIELRDAAGHSVFGAIELTVATDAG